MSQGKQNSVCARRGVTWCHSLLLPRLLPTGGPTLHIGCQATLELAVNVRGRSVSLEPARVADIMPGALCFAGACTCGYGILQQTFPFRTGVAGTWTRQGSRRSQLPSVAVRWAVHIASLWHPFLITQKAPS